MGEIKYQATPFTTDPQGIRIFLPTDQLATCDEYASGDPYETEVRFESAFHQRRVDLTLELIRCAIGGRAPTLRLLDIGCGEGHLTAQIQSTFSRTELTAFDYAASAIRYAQSHFPGIDFSVADAMHMPYVSGYFDIIVCNNLWEHVPNPLDLLGEMARVLKPNGYVVISTPSRYRTRNLARVLLGLPVRLMSPHHVTEYTVGQVIEQLRYGGFSVRQRVGRTIPGSMMEMLAGAIFRVGTFVTGSHHSLDATMFFLAQKNV